MGVVLFVVVVDLEIEYVDIFIMIVWMYVKKEKCVKYYKQYYKQLDGVYQCFGFQYDNQCCQSGGIYCDKQVWMFVNKVNVKVWVIIVFFVDVEIVDGGGKQVLYFGYFLFL